MSRNDLVLLDSVISKNKGQYGEKYDLSEQFELFCFDLILRDNDLSLDEIESGWVDGKDDGGIDGMFFFIDENLVTASVDPKTIRREPELELHIITCKHKDSFKQEPINSIISSATELFDLAKDESELVSDFNDDLLQIRELFRRTYIDIADKSPKLRIIFSYACRGDTSQLGDNISSRAIYLEKITTTQFHDIDASFRFLGASELLALHRVRKTFSLRLKFIEGTISRAKTNYIILARLDSFFDFISDEQGKLRRYLFESNVRDYLGFSPINIDIEDTLRSNDTKDDFDFWWLNNGITILCSSANVAGKEISLENIQIVNGLQTTETIYKYFSSVGKKEDDRAVLVKVIVADEDIVRDRIIKATNNQNPVELASLRATDKIQRDIEHILFNHDWFYDRRKNFYKNQGKPLDRIISPSFVYTGVYALCLGSLANAAKPKVRFMRDEVQYKKVFNTQWKIETYLAVTEIMKNIEVALRSFRFDGQSNTNVLRRQYNFVFAYGFVAKTLKSTKFHPNRLIELMSTPVTTEDLEHIWSIVKSAQSAFLGSHSTIAKTVRRPHRNSPFLETFKNTLDASVN